MADDLESTSKPVVEGAPASTALPVVDRHRYTIDRELGRGAQSIVCLALDAAVGREVAFKMVREAGGNPAFVREARITGQLEHPGIVPVYEIGQDDRGQMYCTQKLVRGRSLRAALDACAGSTDRLALLPHLIDVCNAVAYAHSRGVVHRDLKPDNVMVGEFGETVVLDWGIAKVLGSVDDRAVPRPLEGLAPQNTMQGALMGTPLYLSPEQAVGDVAAIDRRSDVWSLGVMLYELVAGKLPFEAESLTMLLEKVRAGTYRALPDVMPGVSPELAAIVAHALQRNPADRFPDAAAMARELAAFRAGGRLSVYAYSSWELLKRFVARNKALTAIATAAVIGIAAAGTIARQNYVRAEASRLESQARLASELLIRAHQAEARLDWTTALSLFRSAELAVPSEEAQWGIAFSGPMATPAQQRHHLDVKVASASFDRTGRFAACEPDRIRLHGPTGATVVADFPRLPYCEVRLSASGSWLAYPHTQARLHDVKTGAAIELEGTPDARVVAFGPDERPLAVGRWRGTVELFDPETGKKTATLPPVSEETVLAIGFSPDGRQLAAGMASGLITVWDLSTMERTGGYHVRRLPSRILFDRNRLLVADEDRYVEVIDLDTGRVQTLGEHARAITGLEVSRTGAWLATASADGSIVVWDAASLRPMARFLTSVNTASIAFGPDETSLDAVTRDGQLLRWDLTRLPMLITAVQPGTMLGPVAFSPDAGALGWVQSSQAVGTVQLSDRTIARQVRMANVIAWSPRGLGVGTWKGVEVLDPATLAPAVFLDSGGADVRALTWSPDGNTLWAGSGGNIDRWNRQTLAREARVDAGMDARSLTASPDGERVAWAGASDAFVLWNIAAQQAIARTSVATTQIRGLTFSPDGALLAGGADDGTVYLWDGRTGVEKCRGFGHISPTFGVAFAPDGRHLASASLDRTVRLWATADCHQVGTAPPLNGEAVAIDWSSDGRRLAIGDGYGLVTVLTVDQPVAAGSRAR